MESRVSPVQNSRSTILIASSKTRDQISLSLLLQLFQYELHFANTAVQVLEHVAAARPANDAAVKRRCLDMEAMYLSRPIVEEVLFRNVQEATGFYPRANIRVHTRLDVDEMGREIKAETSTTRVATESLLGGVAFGSPWLNRFWRKRSDARHGTQQEAA